ncbi:hypothetical protein G7067_12375 [Leucobacter insecticola]|uniref:Lipoprotein n=1 Tax=Leucobacter insecticola TaxID=2714934 RepID=A0A6G8FLR1_9MICO|nr:hypothetical protein [Leucobacter insecticola]QIM17022.1 hypothetical protein G7067_12375 [Leucobacter insecticola]
MSLSRFTARRIALPLAATLLVAPLAACSGISQVTDSVSGNGSCRVAAEKIDAVIADAQANAPKMIAELITSGKFDAAALVDPVLESLDAAAGTATDPAVIAAIDDARASWNGLAADVQALGAPDLSGLDLGDLGSLGDVKSLSDLGSLGDLGSLSTLQGYGEELSAIVSARLPELQATGAALQEACNAQ